MILTHLQEFSPTGSESGDHPPCVCMYVRAHTGNTPESKHIHSFLQQNLVWERKGDRNGRERAMGNGDGILAGPPLSTHSARSAGPYITFPSDC